MEQMDWTAALRGLDFPAPRNKLIAKAQENGAPDRIMEAIRELPETADFHDADELSQVLGVRVPEEKPRGGWE
jgi:hypothetical protein